MSAIFLAAGTGDKIAFGDSLGRPMINQHSVVARTEVNIKIQWSRSPAVCSTSLLYG